MRVLLVSLVLLFLAGCATTRQPPLAPPGISQELKITLGGWPQSVFIRGRNRANPVLLFIHGGPGFPEMPLSHVNAELERTFTVVHWDQRGAGKSYAPDIPPQSMRVEELVRETTQLTREICQWLGKEKIYLVGFSAGSLTAALAAARHPELYHAYIGLAQYVNIPESERRLHRAGIAQAEARNRPDLLRQLRETGEPPYQTRRDERLVNRITNHLQPRLPGTMSRLRQLLLTLQSPYYSLADLRKIIAGARFSGALMEHELFSHDLRREVPEFDVPVYFFLGLHDTVLSAPLAAEYLARLRAPRGKHLVWFPESNHRLHLEEPARYRAELARVLAATRGR